MVRLEASLLAIKGNESIFTEQWAPLLPLLSHVVPVRLLICFGFRTRNGRLTTVAGWRGAEPQVPQAKPHLQAFEADSDEYLEYCRRLQLHDISNTPLTILGRDLHCAASAPLPKNPVQISRPKSDSFVSTCSASLSFFQ